MRRIRILLLPTLLVVLAGPAGAQVTALDAAAQALRNGSVYVDSTAERAKDIDIDRLRARIRRGDSPIFVAVLPAAAASETGGEPGLLPSALSARTGLRGTYAVLAGNTFRATSNVLRSGRAETLATAAFQARTGDSPQPVLEDFIDRANQATGSGPSNGGGGNDPAADDKGGGGGGGALLLVLALGGGGLFLWSRSRRQRRRKEESKALEADRQLLRAELSVLGGDVLELEPQVTVHADARPDYDAGVTRYQSAQAAMEAADERVDLVRVERVIDEGRYAMARARARIDGREPPPPPENLARPGRHNEPALELDERGAPAYVGYGGMPWYGGGGWFGGGSGLITGLMLGGMFGGWGGGWGGHGGHDDGGRDRGADGGAGDGGGGDGGGDSGGDWGGGDFGGGDFGGGDFGGGDF